jgi:hypothetical protein
MNRRAFLAGAAVLAAASMGIIAAISTPAASAVAPTGTAQAVGLNIRKAWILRMRETTDGYKYFKPLAGGPHRFRDLRTGDQFMIHNAEVVNDTIVPLDVDHGMWFNCCSDPMPTEDPKTMGDVCVIVESLSPRNSCE